MEANTNQAHVCPLLKYSEGLGDQTRGVKGSLVCDVSSCWTIRECRRLVDYSMTLRI